jgi:copper chaperone NosL
MILAVASISLIFIFPIGTIDYQKTNSEKQEMPVWVEKIGNHNEASFANIQVLTSSIETNEALKWILLKKMDIMPYILYGFIISGLIIAMFPFKVLILSWTFGLISLGSASLLNLYYWLKNLYNLDHIIAPIELPGTTYLSPIEEVTLPALGGLVLVLAIIFGIIATYLEYIKKCNSIDCYCTDFD